MILSTMSVSQAR